LDGLELLMTTKDITFNFESQQYLPQAIHKAVKQFYTQSHGKHVSTQAYLEQHQNLVDLIEYCGGKVRVIPAIMTQIMN
jgi:N-dimethylarginine dimethylaminohydrolase